MRIILQRVTEAQVTVDGREVSAIDSGVLALVGIENGDGQGEVRRAADKMHHLRIFEDSDGLMNLACHEVGGAFLVVSQFTLAGSVAKGRRPSFSRAAAPEVAEPLVEALALELAERGNPASRGIFGATMHVRLVNDGPVTFLLEI